LVNQIGQRRHATRRVLVVLAKNTRCVTVASVRARYEL